MYLNARHYDPNTGRFLQQDTYKGDAATPWTQHLYAYCGNNPVNMVDPSGHRPAAALRPQNQAVIKQIEADKQAGSYTPPPQQPQSDNPGVSAPDTGSTPDTGPVTRLDGGGDAGVLQWGSQYGGSINWDAIKAVGSAAAAIASKLFWPFVMMLSLSGSEARGYAALPEEYDTPYKPEGKLIQFPQKVQKTDPSKPLVPLPGLKTQYKQLGDDTPIYRWGGMNPGNFVPRVIDVGGLSYSLSPPAGNRSYSMTTIGAVKGTGVLVPIRDGVTHVSVVPAPHVGSVNDWHAGGVTHPCTTAAHSIAVKVR